MQGQKGLVTLPPPPRGNDFRLHPLAGQARVKWKGGAWEGEEVLALALAEAVPSRLRHPRRLAPPSGLPRLPHPEAPPLLSNPQRAQRAGKVWIRAQGWDGAGCGRPGARREGLGTASRRGPQAGAETGELGTVIWQGQDTASRSIPRPADAEDRPTPESPP